jgi:hypothetical protein
MKLLPRFFIYILFFCIPCITLSQQKTADSLKGKTAQELFDLSATSPGAPILKRTIKKAKAENNLEILINSYYFIAYPQLFHFYGILPIFD